MIGVFFSAYVLLCAEYDCSTATLGWYLQEVSETCVDLRCLEDLLEQCILQHWMSPSELSIPSTAPHSSSQPLTASEHALNMITPHLPHMESLK